MNKPKQPPEHYIPADANQITRDYLDSILIEERLVGAELPDLRMELWGEHFNTPVMAPAFSHLPPFADRAESGLIEYSRAAKQLGAVNWGGMMENETFAEVTKTGARTIRIIKPYADRKKLLSQIAFARNCGALAVGMDIDHIFGKDGKYDTVQGEPMAPVTKKDLKSFASTAEIPFVVKGVLSVRDAEQCAEVGVAGMVISHHSGRMPYAIPPLAVLPEIRKAVGADIKLFVDCSIRSGADVFKALALGADGVSIGRAMFQSLMDEGTAGVIRYFTEVNQELAMIMGFTGAKNLREIDPTTLWLRQNITQYQP